MEYRFVRGRNSCLQMPNLKIHFLWITVIWKKKYVIVSEVYLQEKQDVSSL